MPRPARKLPPLTDTQQQLAEKNLNLARWIVRHRFYVRRHEMPLDEMDEIAFEALCRAAAYFSPERGCSFAAYARRAIERALHVALKIQRRRRSRFVVFCDLENRSEYDSCFDPPAPEGRPPEQDNEDALLLSRLPWILPPRDFALLDEHFRGGVDFCVIAKRDGVCRQAVSQRYRKILRNLRKRFAHMEN